MSVYLMTLLLAQCIHIIFGVFGDDLELTYKTVNSGQQLTITCGTPGAQEEITNCQWTKDGFGLGSEPQLSGWPRYSLAGCDLHIDPVLPVDDGNYRCQASASVNNQTKPYNATVVISVSVKPGPPSIDQSKVDDVMLVEEGEDVELVCQSQGAKPPAEIQWNQQNGNFIFSGVWKNVTRMGNLKTFKTVSKLKFKVKENMNITCSAFNEGFPHPRTSRAIEIKMKLEPHIQMEFSSSKVKEGEPLEVRCIPSPDVQSLRYTWFINGSEVQGHDGSVLRIEKVDKNYDKASIKCIAKNEGGKSEISQMLNVDFSPTILIHPTNKMAKVGETVVFTCQADVSPQTKFIWFKGKSLELVGDSQNLTIIMSEEAESEYVCHVMSEGHQTIASNPARLQIKRKPKILGQTSKLGIINKDIILECTVESLTRSRILWTKDNEPIDESGNKYQVIHSQDQNKQQSHLIIFKLKSTDFTDYGCFASNEVGTDYRIISLEQEKEVDFLTILVCSNVVLIILISLGCLVYRHAKGRQHKENSIYKKENPISKNADTSIFDELLSGNQKEMNQNSIEIRQNMKNMNLVSDNTLM